MGRGPTRSLAWRLAWLAGSAPALLVAPAALGATASGQLVYCTSGDECRYFPDPRLDVTFAAAPGEANVLRVLADPDGVRFRDGGAEIIAGERCRNVDAHEALCGPPAPEGLITNVVTGDGDDSVFLDTGSADLGAGDDVGRGMGVIAGGPGDDDLRAAGGAGFLSGDAGADVLAGAGGRDVLNGGRGTDVVFGAGGADTLGGGSGSDVIEGGRGDDLIRAADGDRDTIHCGPGRDRAVVDPRDRTFGCERVGPP